jgi:hypothetical protein
MHHDAATDEKLARILADALVRELREEIRTDKHAEKRREPARCNAAGSISARQGGAHAWPRLPQSTTLPTPNTADDGSFSSSETIRTL